ncbi:MAG: transcription elongation factor GreA [Allobranchiibius sp.]
MTSTTDASFLTQEAYDRLKAEYAHLTGEGRADISREIEEARSEGDLKENGGYHAAREEQGKMEARIRQLDALLRDAVVGGPTAAEGTVVPGTVVTAKMFGDTEHFLLGSREIVDGSSDLDVYSEKSPLGSAINGKRVGDTVSYEAPNGKTVEVEIIEVNPYK